MGEGTTNETIMPKASNLALADYKFRIPCRFHREIAIDQPTELDDVTTDLLCAFGLANATEEYRKKFRDHKIIDLLKEMQQALLQLEGKSLEDISIKEAYQNYIASMILPLAGIFALGYLNEKISFEHCTYSIKTLFEIRVTHHYGKPGHIFYMISLLNPYFQGLQYNPKADSFPGIELLDRNNRFKLLASEFSSIYSMKQFQTYSQTFINYCGFFLIMSFASALCTLQFHLVPIIFLIAAVSFLGLLLVSTASNLAVGYAQSKKRIKATEIKPFILEEEAKTEELKIRARCLNTIWNYVRETPPAGESLFPTPVS